MSVSTTNMTANRTHESKLAVFYNLNNFLTYSIALRLFDSICANMILWLKRLNFGEIPWLYYCQTCVHEKVVCTHVIHVASNDLSSVQLYSVCSMSGYLSIFIWTNNPYANMGYLSESISGYLYVFIQSNRVYANMSYLSVSQ